MSPSNHFLASWLVAAVTTENRRDRKLVTLAGVLPDADGLGLIVGIIRGMNGADGVHYYHKFHHYLLHGWPGAILVAGLLSLFAREKLRVLLLCLLTFHLHLFCDLIGSRGPGAHDFWPIPYGEPLFRQPVWQWSGQWPLDGWQNQLCLAVLFAGALWFSAKRGFSFLEFFGRRVDSTFVGILRGCQGRLAAFFGF